MSIERHGHSPEIFRALISRGSRVGYYRAAEKIVAGGRAQLLNLRNVMVKARVAMTWRTVQRGVLIEEGSGPF